MTYSQYENIVNYKREKSKEVYFPRTASRSTKKFFACQKRTKKAKKTARFLIESLSLKAFHFYNVRTCTELNRLKAD